MILWLDGCCVEKWRKEDEGKKYRYRL